MKKFYIISVLSLFLLGCASTEQFNKIQIGMTKSEVIQIVGSPRNVSAEGSVEYMTYMISETGSDAYYGRETPFFVRLVNGKVEAYGKKGDFNSTQQVPIRIQSEENITIHHDQPPRTAP